MSRAIGLLLRRQRAAGRIPTDMPLVQTPPRNLPPVDERGDPKHYCPVVF